MIEYGTSTNIMFWNGWNIESIDIIKRIIISRIVLYRALPTEYLSFSKMYNLPIAKDLNRTYKTLHWYPVVLSTT